MPEAPELDAPLMAQRRPPRTDDSALATRLFVVEEDVRELKTAISTGFASLHTKFEERSKIQWPAWTLFLATLISVGGFAYWPIRERQTDLKEELRYQISERKSDSDRIGRESLDRDRRFLDMMIKVQMDLARMEGKLNGRN